MTSYFDEFLTGSKMLKCIKISFALVRSVLYRLFSKADFNFCFFFIRLSAEAGGNNTEW